MIKNNRPIKPKQIITLVLVILFYFLVIGVIIWSISGSSEIANHSRFEFKRGLIILFGLIFCISIMIGIGLAIEAIAKHWGEITDWLRYNKVIDSFIRWFQKKF
ncbi:MAG TPA: hypothetical protein PLL94_10805 [Bacteroidales bacterium]|nr:hypothetical protein [Bacteroidales bacterium]HQK68624.1 hypothetical protein [Bacteroidales bacterium]